MSASILSRSLRLMGVMLWLWGGAGCGAIPGTTLPAGQAPDVTWLDPPASGSYVTDKVLVKLKSGQAIRAIQGLRSIQQIEGLTGTGVYAVPGGQTVAEALARLRQDPSVAYAEPDYIYHATGLRAEATVNDPMFDQLWGIRKIQAPQAWDTTTGDPNVIVAVVDTGVDYNHPDLQGQVIKGPNLVAGTDDPMDDQGHGSHVAGTIAAIGNNGTGVVGIAYHTKILAIKVLGSDGSGDTDHIAQGILKASELGARVISLSLGGPQASSVLQDAVDQATARGSLCVVAAGNDGTETPNYPAAYPNSLSVGATDQNDARATFSSFGSTLAIAAPGVDILSSTGGSYKQESGTSMATPHVSGSAALLLAKNPGLSVAQLRTALTTTGDPTTGFSSNPVQRLNVAKALASVAGTAPTPAPAQPPVSAGDTQAPSIPTGLKALAASTSQVELAWNAATDNVGVAGYRVYRDGQTLGSTNRPGYADANLIPGHAYAYTVAAFDAAGNVSGQAIPANVVTPSSSTQLTLHDVALKDLSRTSATLSWSTSVGADTRVDYSSQDFFLLGFWQTSQSSELVTAHSQTLEGLVPGRIYYLKVTSQAPDGSRVTAGLYGLRTPL